MQTSQSYLLGSAILSGVLVISIGIFLGVGIAKRIPGGLIFSTWVSFNIYH